MWLRDDLLRVCKTVHLSFFKAFVAKRYTDTRNHKGSVGVWLQDDVENMEDCPPDFHAIPSVVQNFCC